MPELLPVAIEFAFTLRAGHPKIFVTAPPGLKLRCFRISCETNIHHRDAEYIELGVFSARTLYSATFRASAVNSPILSPHGLG